MALKVMHAENGNVQRKAERRSNACTHQQCAGQPRSLRVSYGVDIPEILSGFSQALLQEGQHAAYVIAGGEFGHYAAIFTVHLRLRVKRVAQQTVMGMIKRNPGFVAGCFDSQYEQRRSGWLCWLDRLYRQGAGIDFLSTDSKNFCTCYIMES